MSNYWPIALIVVSNVFYHICSKSVPERLNPFAALTVTYLLGAVLAAVSFFLLNPGQNLFHQYREVNWSTFVLGISIVGLEIGNIYMYKVGWSLGVGQLVQSSILTVILLLVGYLVYHEAITVTKLVGIAVCLVGLYLLNK